MRNIEQLRFENEMLRLVVLGRQSNLPPEWKIARGNETRLMGLFLGARGVVTREQVFAAVYEDRNTPDVDHAVLAGNLVRAVRRKLAPFGIDVVTHWGQGYELVPSGPEIVAAYFRIKRRRDKQKSATRVRRMSSALTDAFTLSLRKRIHSTSV